MIRTIEELRALAAQIEEATRQGENTQLRVGGLFMDIIDFIGQIPVTETILGPLLTALNNSQLINPTDGQTLTFSIMKDNWTFSDALTQLQLGLDGISMTVSSNYQDWLIAKDQINAYLALIDQRTSSLESDNVEYHSWRSQTDDKIVDMVVAQDKITRDIVSISADVMTAFEQIRTTTDNLEISDKALKKICDLCEIDYNNPEGTYSASWLYQNKQQIIMAAANFDEDGNIVQGSSIDVALDGITARVENVDGRVTQISQTVDSIQLAVAGDQQQIETLNGYISGSSGLLARMGAAENRLTADEGTLNQHASTLQVHDNAIVGLSAKFNPDGSLANTSGLVTSSDFSSLFTEAYDATGATTHIANLETNLNGISGTVASNSAAISNMNRLINGDAQNPGIVTRLNTAESTITSYSDSVAWVQATKNKITNVIANFDSQGHPVSASGIVTTGNFSTLFATYFSGEDVVTSAELSVAVEDFVDENGVKQIVSEATIQADKINMNGDTFTGWLKTWKVQADDINWIFKNAVSWYYMIGSSTPTEVMRLDSSGNLYITGTLTQGCKDANGIATAAASKPFKVQYIRTDDASYGDSIKWEGGSTILFWGSGTKYFYLPSRTNIRTVLGLADGASFVVELNIVNVASSNIHMKFDYTGTNTTHPRWMGYDNQIHDSTPLDMGNGDLVKVVLVYNSPNYNAYIIDYKTEGWY